MSIKAAVYLIQTWRLCVCVRVSLICGYTCAGVWSSTPTTSRPSWHWQWAWPTRAWSRKHVRHYWAGWDITQNINTFWRTIITCRVHQAHGASPTPHPWHGEDMIKDICKTCFYDKLLLLFFIINTCSAFSVQNLYKMYTFFISDSINNFRIHVGQVEMSLTCLGHFWAY